MKAKRLAVLLVNFRESADLVRKTAQERGYAAPVLLDASGDVTGRIYGVWGPPTAYLIDRQGEEFHVPSCTDRSTSASTIRPAGSDAARHLAISLSFSEVISATRPGSKRIRRSSESRFPVVPGSCGVNVTDTS